MSNIFVSVATSEGFLKSMAGEIDKMEVGDLRRCYTDDKLYLVVGLKYHSVIRQAVVDAVTLTEDGVLKEVFAYFLQEKV